MKFKSAKKIVKIKKLLKELSKASGYTLRNI